MLLCSQYNFGKLAPQDLKDAYRGTAWAVREKLIEGLEKTEEYWRCVRSPFSALQPLSFHPPTEASDPRGMSA